MQRARHLELLHIGMPRHMLLNQLMLLTGPAVLTTRQIGDVLGMDRRTIDYYIHKYNIKPQRELDTVKGTLNPTGIDILVEIVRLREDHKEVPDILFDTLPILGSPAIVGHIIDVHPDVIRRMRRKKGRTT